MVMDPRPVILLAFCALALTLSYPVVGCNTGAVGVSECREIERARCRAAAACGTVEDAEECQRFYRDHCLHGIAAPEVPTESAGRACVTAIEEAGQCAEEDPTMSRQACTDLTSAGGTKSDGSSSAPGIGGASARSAPVCDFVAAPWEFPICDYLVPPPDEGAGGSSQ